MMKKFLTGSVAALVVLLMSVGASIAANGSDKGSQGVCDGTGISIVCSGTPVEFTGVVSDINYAGSGLEVTIDESTVVTVYGIGPYHYWALMGVDRPEIGDTVTVSGMEVDLNGVLKIVAMSMIVNGETIELREPCVDGTGGQPLWRSLRRHQRP
ncbi:conserved exported hypothetical protein [uncultured Desulfatiglans sp.]|nr:conserved exported hypothetical protein [uncultured Desulfatiglans sp.]